MNNDIGNGIKHYRDDLGNLLSQGLTAFNAYINSVCAKQGTEMQALLKEAISKNSIIFNV